MDEAGAWLMRPRRPPVGFELALPDTWEVVEAPPSQSVRLTFGDAPPGLAGASRRLRQVERAQDGTSLRARYLEVVDGVPTEAELTIGFYAIGSANDPDAMLAELSEGGVPDGLDLVELPAGTAVRRAGRGPAGRRGAAPAGKQLIHQVYLPVPGTDDEVAFLGFSSPTVDREAELRMLFDRVVSGLSFSWTDAAAGRRGPEAAGRRGPAGPAGGNGGLRLRTIARSALAGWPARFRPLAHVAVGLWGLAALVYLARSAAALTGGDTGLGLLRLARAGSYACFGPLGYLFDKPRSRSVLVLWVALGALWTFLGLTCPEASVFGRGC